MPKRRNEFSVAATAAPILIGLLLLCTQTPAWARCAADSAAATVLFTEPGYDVSVVVGGLQQPTGFAFAPPPDNRIFIAEKRGTVRIFKDGELLLAPFIALTDVNDYHDHGLVGIALDPNFNVNHYVYLSYTKETGGAYDGPKVSRLVRVQVIGDVADPNPVTRAVLLDDIPLNSASHTIDGLRFAPDGTLFVSVGDGADFDSVDPLAYRAQNLDSLNGKLLRINTDGAGPVTNPFYNGNPNSARSKIWSYGLRNPFRYSFKPGSVIPYIADVGWDTWEEVNVGRPGGNFGWPCREGPDPAPGYTCQPMPAAIDPIYAYPHDGSGASITSAGFWRGAFYFGDYTRGFIRKLMYSAADTVISVSDFAVNAGAPVDMIAGPEGDLYYLSYGDADGELRRIRYIGSAIRPPIARIAAGPGAGRAPLIVRFSGASSASPDGVPLTYQWDFGDGAPTATGPEQAHTYTRNGVYTCSLTVNDGRGGTATTTARVPVGNESPRAMITAPVQGATYTPGNTVTYAGSAYDPDAGPLAASQLRWTVIQHHNTHTHTVMRNVSGATGSFTTDTNSQSIWYEMVLTATSATGLTDTRRVAVYPDVEPPEPPAEDFSAPALDPSWSWNAPAGPTYSLSQRPGFLRLSVPNTQAFNHWTDANAAPQLRRTDMGSGDWSITTRAELSAYATSAPFHSGLLVQFGPYNLFYWGFYAGTNLRLERSGQPDLINAINNNGAVWLRVRKRGTLYFFEWSPDDEDWHVAGTQTAREAVQAVGLITRTWDRTTVVTDFDTFDVVATRTQPFDTATLDPAWMLQNLQTTDDTLPRYSLTDRPGFFRLQVPDTQPFDFWTDPGDTTPALMRSDMGHGDWTIVTRLELSDYTPDAPFQSGLMMQLDTLDYYYWGFYGGTNLALNLSGQRRAALQVANTSSSIWLRLCKVRRAYHFDWSRDGIEWRRADTKQVREDIVAVGLLTRTLDVANVTTDFGYFELIPSNIQ